MRVRRATQDDAAFIAAIYRPHVEERFASFEQVAPDAAEIGQRMMDAGDVYPWLVADEDGTVLGYAYAGAHRARHAYRWSVDTAIYVEDAAQGRGVGRALYSALLNALIRQNFVMAFGGISMPNEGSIALHKAMGFELVGRYRNVGFKQGAWRDTEWWGRPLAMSQAPPAALHPVSTVIGDVLDQRNQAPT